MGGLVEIRLLNNSKKTYAQVGKVLLPTLKRLFSRNLDKKPMKKVLNRTAKRSTDLIEVPKGCSPQT